jgi:hypothetical protein
MSQDYETIENIKTILTGDNFDIFNEQQLTYSDITPEVERGVITELKKFFNFLFDLNHVICFKPFSPFRCQEPKKKQRTWYSNHSQNNQASHYLPSFLFVKIKPNSNRMAATVPLSA